MVNSKLFFEKKNKLAFLSVLVRTLNEDFTMAYLLFQTFINESSRNLYFYWQAPYVSFIKFLIMPNTWTWKL